MLVKSIPWVNFTIMFTHSFKRADPKGAKRQSSHECLFVLIKAAPKHFDEINPHSSLQGFGQARLVYY